MQRKQRLGVVCDAGENVTVNRAMITDYLKSEIEARDPGGIWSQPDVTRQLPVEMLQRVIEKRTQRMDQLKRSRGQRLKRKS